MDRYLCDVLVTMDGPAGAVPEPIIDGAVDVDDDGRIAWCGPAAAAPARPGEGDGGCHTRGRQ